MDVRTRLRYATWLLLIGGLLALGWTVVSMLDLFDIGGGGGFLRVLRHLGPLGLTLVILGGILCQWDLPALRREASDE